MLTKSNQNYMLIVKVKEINSPLTLHKVASTTIFTNLRKKLTFLFSSFDFDLLLLYTF